MGNPESSSNVIFRNTIFSFFQNSQGGRYGMESQMCCKLILGSGKWCLGPCQCILLKKQRNASNLNTKWTLQTIIFKMELALVVQTDADALLSTCLSPCVSHLSLTHVSLAWVHIMNVSNVPLWYEIFGGLNLLTCVGGSVSWIAFCFRYLCVYCECIQCTRFQVANYCSGVTWVFRPV